MLEYLTSSLNEVYSLIGEQGMSYYYVPYLEHSFKNSRDYINYDFNNKIKIHATINSEMMSDFDLEFAQTYLKHTQGRAKIQFTLQSIYPYKVRPLDRIYIERTDGIKENYLIVGIDDGVLLQGVYISVRAFKFDGTLTKFQWADNGEQK